MAAFMIADVQATDPERYTEYTSQVPATVEKYGGRFVVRGGAFETIEGEWQPGRIVMIEFPSMERAKAWYDSPEYQAIIPLREKYARTGFLTMVEGT